MNEEELTDQEVLDMVVRGVAALAAGITLSGTTNRAGTVIRLAKGIEAYIRGTA